MKSSAVVSAFPAVLALLCSSAITASPKWTNRCDYNVAMCCWVRDRNAHGDTQDGIGPASDPRDNTDVCFIRADTATPLTFPGESEGAVHCHGWAWSPNVADATYQTREDVMEYVRKQDHMIARGYVGSVPGSPQCACLEDMAVVSRADCTTTDGAGGFTACDGSTANDLLSFYDDVLGQPFGDISTNVNLLGECPA
ncbi:unnamed protein product [Phaeothamnion confervicola]